MLYVLVAVIGYLFGSIPVGLIIVKQTKGVDVRNYGSGNIGTVNVYRVAGGLPAILVLIADAAKGLIPVILAQIIVGTPSAVIIAAITAIAGHNWSAFLGFKGGKGVATTLGVLLGIAPWVGIIAGLIWLGFVITTKYSSLGSIIAAVAVPFIMLSFHEPLEYVLFTTLAALFIVYRHRSNLSRLVHGKELKIGERINVTKDQSVKP